MRIVIGGIRFGIFGDGCRVGLSEDNLHRSFVVSMDCDLETPEDVRVRVTTEGPGTLDGEVPVLYGEDWWQMYGAPEGYRLVFRDRIDQVDRRVVRSDLRTERVSVHALDVGCMPGGEPPIVVDPLNAPLDYILTMNHLAYRDGLILHSAGVDLGGNGFVFTGVSGAGKTTLTRLFMSGAPYARPLSDDRMVIRRQDGVYRAFGTPWPGDAGVAENESVDLAALFFLTKADRPKLVRLTAAQAVRRMFPMVSCPWYDRERVPLVLDTCEGLVNSVPCYDLHFTQDGSTVALIEDFAARGTKEEWSKVPDSALNTPERS